MDPGASNRVSGILGPKPEGLPAPEPGQYSEPKNSPSTLAGTANRTVRTAPFHERPSGHLSHERTLKG